MGSKVPKMEKIIFLTLLFISAHLASTSALPRSKRHIGERIVAQPYDLNGDGQVTEKEVFLGESYLGLYYFRALDKNGDEAITRAELRTAHEQEGYEEDVVERRATEDFDWADVNGDDEWDMGEYLRWYTWDSGEEEIDEDFRAVDKDGNGLISEEELGRSYEGVVEFRSLAKTLI